MFMTMCNTSNSAVMDEDGNINEKLLKEEILKNDPTGLAAADVDLGLTGVAGLEGLGNASGTETQTEDFGLRGDDGLGGYGNTGIQATTTGHGHEGLGTRNNNELYGVADKLTQLYEDLLLELEGQGKKEIIERLKATDFGFQTRFERKIIPIN